MRRLAFIAALSVAILFSCSKKDVEQKAPYLAKVGQERITQADFDREFETLPDYARQMFEGPEGKGRFLDEIIKKELLYQEAREKGFEKSKEYQEKLKEFEKLTLISEIFEKEIISKALVTDEEARDFFDRNRHQFSTTTEIRARHILLATEEEAKTVVVRLEKGEKFEDLAKTLSIDKVSAENGGDIGYFSRGQMVPEFEKAAVALSIGEMSGPVKTPFGYHIIEVLDKKEGPAVEFENVKAMIMQKMSNDKQKEIFENYVAELKKKYKIEINRESLKDPSAEQEKIEESEKPEAVKTEKPEETEEQKTGQPEEPKAEKSEEQQEGHAEGVKTDDGPLDTEAELPEETAEGKDEGASEESKKEAE